ncbi:hypothetical protein PtA15_15A327 [Puccinia triticina]|uniref:Ataxin-2 C-terminal domain-containing protein n=1 Tax=Puccinia triticina TaxID=208348 RepID=A0ABY7D2U1_9BASI|nr:uncharacterized protein PtA15_15A327 [Puccinia triticina]WAQ91934.1 hypothetical protein PtA15_15A327 [Puccinia triticina]
MLHPAVQNGMRRRLGIEWGPPASQETHLPTQGSQVMVGAEAFNPAVARRGTPSPVYPPDPYYRLQTGMPRQSGTQRGQPVLQEMQLPIQGSQLRPDAEAFIPDVLRKNTPSLAYTPNLWVGPNHFHHGIHTPPHGQEVHPAPLHPSGSATHNLAVSMNTDWYTAKGHGGGNYSKNKTKNYGEIKDNVDHDLYKVLPHESDLFKVEIEDDILSKLPDESDLFKDIYEKPEKSGANDNTNYMLSLDSKGTDNIDSPKGPRIIPDKGKVIQPIQMSSPAYTSEMAGISKQTAVQNGMRRRLGIEWGPPASQETHLPTQGSQVMVGAEAFNPAVARRGTPSPVYPPDPYYRLQTGMPRQSGTQRGQPVLQEM